MDKYATCTSYKAEGGQLFMTDEGHVYSLSGLAEYVLELAEAGYYATATEHPNIALFINDASSYIVQCFTYL